MLLVLGTSFPIFHPELWAGPVLWSPQRPWLLQKLIDTGPVGHTLSRHSLQFLFLLLAERLSTIMSSLRNSRAGDFLCLSGTSDSVWPREDPQYLWVRGNPIQERTL